MCGELGENLATIAWGKLADYPEARVFASSFEKWPLEQEAFDLVVSATAFHWVDPAIRYRKSAQALRPAGSLALLCNAHDPRGPERSPPAQGARVGQRTEAAAPRADRRQGGRDRGIEPLRETRGASLPLRGGSRCGELPAAAWHLLEPQGPLRGDSETALRGRGAADRPGVWGPRSRGYRSELYVARRR